MKKPSYEFAFAEFKNILSYEFDRHVEILNSDKLSYTEKEEFVKIHTKKAEKVAYFSSIKFSCTCLWLNNCFLQSYLQYFINIQF